MKSMKPAKISYWWLIIFRERHNNDHIIGYWQEIGPTAYDTY